MGKPLMSHGQPLLRKIIALSSGYALAQLLLLVTMPLLTRIYSPSSFSVLGYLLALAITVQPLLSWKLNFALPLCRNEKELSTLYQFCLLLVLATSLVLGLIAVACHTLLMRHFSLTPTLILLFTLTLMGQGWAELLTLFAIKHDRTKHIAQARVARNLCFIAAQLLLAWVVGTSALSLVVASLIGLAINIAWLAKRSPKPRPSRINWPLLSKLLRRFYKFPLYSSWPAVINNLATWLPLLVIGSYFGSTYAGWYFVITRLVQMPLGLLQTATSQVLLKSFADLHLNNESLKPLFIKALKYLALIACLVFLGCLLLSPLLGWILGQKWHQGGVILFWLAPAFALTFCFSPLSILFGVVNRNELCSLWQFFHLLLTALAMSFGIISHSFSNLLHALSLSWSVSYLVLGVLMWVALKPKVHAIKE